MQERGDQVLSDLKDSLKSLETDRSFNVLLQWLKNKRAHALKTFSTPPPKEQELIHYHMGGRYSAYDEIITLLEDAWKT